MAELHKEFNDAMLQPGFFDDAPSGSAPKPIDPVQGEQPQKAVASPVDNSALPPFLSFADFPKQHELIMPPQLIEGILHQGSKCVIGGEPKTNKTWLVLDMALSIASGTKFLGRDTTQGGVIFMDFEVQSCFFQNRAWMVYQAKGLSVPPKNFYHWSLRGKCYDPNRLLNILEERLSAMTNVRVLVADPVYKLQGAVDENNNSQVTELLKTLEQFSERTGCALVFTHHFSKSGSINSGSSSGSHFHKLSGASSWARDPDSILTLSHHDEPGCLKVECTMRNLPSPDPFCVEFDAPKFILRDDIIIPKRVNQNSPVKPEQILELLVEAKELSPERWQSISIQKFGITRTQFDKLVGILRAQSEVFVSNSDAGYTFKPNKEE